MGMGCCLVAVNVGAEDVVRPAEALGGPFNATYEVGPVIKAVAQRQAENGL